MQEKHLLVLQDVCRNKEKEKLVFRKLDRQRGSHERVVLVGARHEAARQILQFRLVGEQDLGEQSFVVGELLGGVADGQAAHTLVRPGRVAAGAFGYT